MRAREPRQGDTRKGVAAGCARGEVAGVRDRGAAAGVRAREGGRGARHRAAVGVRRAGGSSGPQKKYFVLPLMTDIPAFWIFDHSGIPHK